MRGAQKLTLLGGTLLLATQVASKAAIAHYMLGKVTEEHVKTDLEKAKAAGFDAFAMNVGCVEPDWVDEVLGYMFNNAAAAGMGVYLNMDLYASGDACWNGASCCDYANDYTGIWNKYKNSNGWFKIDGKNLVSTFSAANWSRKEFNAWRSRWDEGNLFFMPDFDNTTGYWEGAAGWEHWGETVDGIASWESSWPEYAGHGGAFPGDVGPDLKPFHAAQDHGAEYMIPISPLQYKAAYKTNLYRLGDMNLPVRMENILAMSPRPNYVQFQTWNDGPESHYIGDIWPEQNHDYQPWKYMNPDRYDHRLRLATPCPILQQCVPEGGSTAASMDTADGKIAEGAIWYPSFPRNTECNGPDGLYSEAPTNYKAGVEGVYFAVVMKQGLAPGHTLKVWSGNTETPAVYDLQAGLNYGSAEVLNRGAQFLEILDPSGKRVASAAGGMCVAASCPRGIAVRNYHVVGVEVGDQGATCTPWPREQDEPDPDPDATKAPPPSAQPTTTTAQGPPPEETDGAIVKWLNNHNKGYPCKDEVEKAKSEHRTTSYGCIGFWPGAKSVPWERADPYSEWVALGHCTCDDPVLNLVGDTFLEALPVIAEVGCYVLMSSFKLVLDIALNAIPEGKALTAPMRPRRGLRPLAEPCGNNDLVPDEVKNVFDTLNSIADAAAGFKVPSKIGKGSGRRGDEGNPGAGKPKPTKTNGQQTTSKRPSETSAAKCSLKPANAVGRQGAGVVTSRECNKGATTTHAYTITSLAYAATAKPTLVAATCSGKWGQACQHYSSRHLGASGPDLKAAATDAWARQHGGAGWQSAAYRDEKLCDRAEYPPTYLMGGVGKADSKQCGVGPNQVVRWVPREQNRGAAHMWNNICFDTPLGAMSDAEMYEAAKNKNFGAKTKVRAPTKTEYTVGVTVAHIPQFTISSWEHKATKDDGLWDNPCWPKEITPNDPGFALLESDPWYARNSKKPAFDYSQPYAPGTNGPSNGPAPVQRRDWAVEGNDPFNNGTFSTVTKRDYEGNGPGIEAELYLTENPENAEVQEFTIGPRIGQGADGSIYTVTVEADGWDPCQTWVLKKDYVSIRDCNHEYAAYAALENHGIAPAFGAQVLDYETDDMVRMGLILGTSRRAR
ncbi:hypothetical protein PG997_002213 [Apiospora hydei]|uniref:Uncharacterized protein n=1 Tax=Apiospora hydei TaxID=1337664 RepID=A0ABR1X8K0_9PEZI